MFLRAVPEWPMGAYLPVDEPVGHAWVNAAIVSFFSSLETGRIARKYLAHCRAVVFATA
jgi:hypothetical protein